MIVLDTNVISELMKPSRSAEVIGWMSAQTAADLFTTTITVAEILYGIEILPKGKRRDQLLREAEGVFGEDFSGRILMFDESAARMFALIATERRRHGNQRKHSCGDRGHCAGEWSDTRDAQHG